MRAAISDKIRFETAFFAKLVDPPGIMVREIETGGRFAGAACPVGSDHGHLMMIEELVHIHDGVLVGPFVMLTAAVPVIQGRARGFTRDIGQGPLRRPQPCTRWTLWISPGGWPARAPRRPKGRCSSTLVY